jgi:hypothetical protein
LKEAKENLKPLLRSSKRLGHGYFPEYDILLNSIGTGIENLAEIKYGAPTDEQLKSAMYPFTSHTYYKDIIVALNEGNKLSNSHVIAENKLYSDFGPQIKEVVGALLEKRNEAYRSALMDSGVIFANPNSLQYAKGSDKKAVDSVKNALYFYPQVWVDASNERHLTERPFAIKSTRTSTERAEYDPKKQDFDEDWNFIDVSRLTVSTDSRYLVGNDPSMRVALHEFAHRVQHTVKTLPRHEIFFLDRRSGYFAADGVPPEKTTRIYDWLEEEGIRDGFPNHYMGENTSR